jgi:hypothetical protein
MKISHSEQVAKIAKAARVLRWSEQVEAKRGQTQSITKMQIQTMDHMMGAGEEQIKLPNPKTVSPSALLSKLKPYCRSLTRLALGRTGRLFQMAAMTPSQFGNTRVLRRGFHRQGRAGRRASP